MYRFITALVITTLATAAVGETYDCTMTRKGSDGFIGDRMVLSVDPETGGGAALDWAVYAVHKTPIPVDLTQTSADRWRFKYTVRNVPVGNEGAGIVSYTVRLNTARMRVSVTGRLHGYDNNITGSGQCTKVK